MIFVLVGLHTQGFERLIRKLDELTPYLGQKVIIQIGYTKYCPKNAEYFRFKPPEEIDELVQKTDVIVCHDGAGSILSALQHGKRTIVVPRMKIYGECAYDNRGDLANQLAKLGLITLVQNIDDIGKLIIEPASTVTRVQPTTPWLIKALRDYINICKSK